MNKKILFGAALFALSIIIYYGISSMSGFTFMVMDAPFQSQDYQTNSNFNFTTTEHFDLGDKNNLDGSYQVETSSDSYAYAEGSFGPASRYHDKFTANDKDGVTWKWALANPWGYSEDQIQQNVRTTISDEIMRFEYKLYDTNRVGNGYTTRALRDVKLNWNFEAETIINMTGRVGMGVYFYIDENTLMGIWFDDYSNPDRATYYMYWQNATDSGEDYGSISNFEPYFKLKLERIDNGINPRFKITPDWGVKGTYDNPILDKTDLPPEFNSDISIIFEPYFAGDGTLDVLDFRVVGGYFLPLEENFRLSGNWISPKIILPMNKEISSITVDYVNATSDDYVKSIGIYDPTGNYKFAEAVFTTQTQTGTSATITESNLTYGTFEDVIGEFSVKVELYRSASSNTYLAVTEVSGEFSTIEPYCDYVCNTADCVTGNATISNVIICLNDDIGDGIVIGANNVRLDCQGHTISGDGTVLGISSQNVIRTKIVNCIFSNLNGSIFLHDANRSLIYNNTFSTTTTSRMIQLNATYNSIILKNEIFSKDWTSIDLIRCQFNSVILNTINSSRYGLSLSQSSNNNIIENKINTGRFAISMGSNNAQNLFLNNNISASYDALIINSPSLLKPNRFFVNGAEFSFNTTIPSALYLNVLNSPIGTLPEGYVAVGPYFNITNISTTDWLYLNITYDESTIPENIWNLSGVRIWKYSGGGWYNETYVGPTTQAGVDIYNDVVYANITNFSVSGIYAPMAQIDTPPVITISAPADGIITNNSSIIFNFTVVDDHTVNMKCIWNIPGYIRDGQLLDINNNTPKAENFENFQSGTYSFYYNCTDGLLNTISETRTFTVDRTPPMINAISKNADGTTYDRSGFTNSPYVITTLECDDGEGIGCDKLYYCTYTPYSTCNTNAIWANLRSGLSSSIIRNSNAVAYDANNEMMYFSTFVTKNFYAYNIAGNTIHDLSGIMPPTVTSIRNIAYDTKEDKLYMILDLGGSYHLGVYNPETNEITSLNAFLYSTEQIIISPDSELLFVVGTTGEGHGILAEYDIAMGTWTNLTIIPEIRLNRLAYDSNNDLVYTGGANNSFGVYNRTDDIWYDLSGVDTGGWMDADSNNFPFHIVQDPKTELIYVFTTNAKFGVYNRTSNEMTQIATPWTLYPLSVIHDSYKNLYIGLASGKLYMYDTVSKKFTDFSTADSGNWVGTEDVFGLAFNQNSEKVYTVSKYFGTDTKIGELNTKEYLSPINVSNEGITIISAYAADLFGSGSNHEFFLRIDRILPNTTYSAVTADGASYTFGAETSSEYVNVTIECTDGSGNEHSQCYELYYCTDGSNSCTPNTRTLWVYNGGSPFTQTFKISKSDGSSYFRFYVTDNAGNIKETQSLMMKFPIIPKTGTGGSTSVGGTTLEGTTIQWDGTLLESGMGLNDKITFFLENVQHTIQLTSISTDSIVFRISSDPFPVTVNIGETKLVDVNNDGTNDISLRFDGLRDGRAVVVFESLETSKITAKTFTFADIIDYISNYYTGVVSFWDVLASISSYYLG